MMIHKGLTPERWFSLSIHEQLANVGCDVDRAIRWRNKGQLQMSREAFDRALELLILTIRDPKNRGPRLKELCRAKELLVDYFVYDNIYKSTDKDWHNFFFPFNYAAALQKGK